MDQTDSLIGLLDPEYKKPFFGRPIGFGKSTLLSILMHYRMNPQSEILQKTKLHQKIEEIRTRLKAIEEKPRDSKTDQDFYLKYKWLNSVGTAPVHVLYFNFKALNNVNCRILKENLMEEIRSYARVYQWGDISRYSDLSLICKRRHVEIYIDDIDAPLKIYEYKMYRLYEEISIFYEELFTADRIFATGSSLPNEPFDVTNCTDKNEFCRLGGFTEEEIRSVFPEEISKFSREYSSFFSKLRRWYGGYCFSEEMVPLFNPGSILKFMKTGLFRKYWEGETDVLDDLFGRWKPICWQLPRSEEDSLIFTWDLKEEKIRNGGDRLLSYGYHTLTETFTDEFYHFCMGVVNEEARLALIEGLIRNIEKCTAVYNISKQVHEVLETGTVLQFLDALIIALIRLPKIWTRTLNYRSRLLTNLAILRLYAKEVEGSTNQQFEIIIYGKAKIVLSISTTTLKTALTRIRQQDYSQWIGETTFECVALRVFEETGSIEEAVVGIEYRKEGLVQEHSKRYEMVGGKLKEVERESNTSAGNDSESSTTNSQ